MPDVRDPHVPGEDEVGEEHAQHELGLLDDHHLVPPVEGLHLRAELAHDVRHGGDLGHAEGKKITCAQKSGGRTHY